MIPAQKAMASLPPHPEWPMLPPASGHCAFSGPEERKMGCVPKLHEETEKKLNSNSKPTRI